MPKKSLDKCVKSRVSKSKLRAPKNVVTVKVIALEKVSFSDIQNLKTVC